VSAGPVVAYSGEPGAFAEDAVLEAYGEDVERRGLPGFRAAFDAVASGEASVAVVPIENLLGGSVRETYDLLLEHDLRVVGEVVVPVRLCLAALPGQRLEEIGRVYSHIQALGQAERFLATRRWELLTTYNTAGAGRRIVDVGERGAAAVLSPRAARTWGLEILADDVADVRDNRTRFLAVAREGAVLPAWRGGRGDGQRTLLAFGVRNEPGTLLAALRVFADRGLNLSRLESRPSRAGRWEYVFWVDLDADAAEPAAVEALTALRRACTMVRVFGSYGRPAEPAVPDPDVPERLLRDAAQPEP
jgi:prephenate dehydratase